MNSGCFISIEGPEGAGKTTIINMLANELIKGGRDVVATREPGGIDISEQIRGVILKKENTMMDARTEALLYAAARRQHLVEKVEPALGSGKIVLCDRFIDSSLAYQGHARGLGVEEVYLINRFAIEETMPILTIYFDLDPVVGLERINQHRDHEVNRLDLENIEFHRKVREGYLLLAERFSSRIVTIDASQPLEQVFKEASEKIEELLQRMKP
ncbi:dTMP kinase [Mesobacillus zeae]|uniref:Thymidylate kinase n=1 Tax=Mesobacillus zeae TaxID=1917180 RepID=A0A398BG80_9BACI|nr:dTMP kinase [Mesobacillus zeae]RID88624.1 dTMP kinase [Mesobacillus zeae]